MSTSEFRHFFIQHFGLRQKMRHQVFTYAAIDVGWSGKRRKKKKERKVEEWTTANWT
jgi:hypothetical protein